MSKLNVIQESVLEDDIFVYFFFVIGSLIYEEKENGNVGARQVRFKICFIGSKITQIFPNRADFALGCS